MTSRRLECGLARNRVRRRIQEHLDRLGKSMADVSREIGISRQLVAATVAGEKHNGRVLTRLRELGVPERYLFDPTQCEQKQEEAA
ncbi:MAG: helix-turn-helix domain-containing protein [Proteobacteria bacterium]|nr:helix-turn-helix domain-containing protein [Pseudomonadota bacterium]MBU1596108.1 helix-turn-helix domain-containing protein [Pseudomonadota bacterium]